MFYVFVQNSNGGRFKDYRYVIVEAEDSSSANTIAELSGLVYFDGHSKRIRGDCYNKTCCQERWWRVSDNEATLDPIEFLNSKCENLEDPDSQSLWVILMNGQTITNVEDYHHNNSGNKFSKGDSLVSDMDARQRALERLRSH